MFSKFVDRFNQSVIDIFSKVCKAILTFVVDHKKHIFSIFVCLIVAILFFWWLGYPQLLATALTTLLSVMATKVVFNHSITKENEKRNLERCKSSIKRNLARADKCICTDDYCSLAVYIDEINYNTIEYICTLGAKEPPEKLRGSYSNVACWLINIMEKSDPEFESSKDYPVFREDVEGFIRLVNEVIGSTSVGDDKHD